LFDCCHCRVVVVDPRVVVDPLVASRLEQLLSNLFKLFGDFSACEMQNQKANMQNRNEELEMECPESAIQSMGLVVLAHACKLANCGVTLFDTQVCVL
jgi:hypothetical protein